jgi:hypothetical protein
VVRLRHIARLSVGCLAVSLLSLLGVALFGLVVPAAERSTTGVRITAAVLFVGLTTGAVVGHILGLVAFFRLGSVAPNERSRALALLSVVLGVLMLISCTLLGVVSAPAFDSVAGAG